MLCQLSRRSEAGLDADNPRVAEALAEAQASAPIAHCLLKSLPSYKTHTALP